MTDLIIEILTQGLIYGIMAMGVYITYTILDFPDLSVDGTFPLGTAICFIMLNKGINPWLTLLAAFLVGCVAGAFTGFLNVKLKIKNLLCGILTMTALYSINYAIVGQPNGNLNVATTTTIFSKISLPFASKLFVILIIALAAKFALDWYLRTKSGFLLRSVGDNEGLVITLAQNPGTIKIIGLAIANGLVALAGAVNCNYTRTFDVGGGTGTVVMGLAAVIIGTTVFKKVKFLRVTTGVILGMIVYKACIQIAITLGLNPMYTKVMISALFILTLVLNQFLFKTKKAGVRKNA
jgi:putative ABC transport system permease protein